MGCILTMCGLDVIGCVYGIGQGPHTQRYTVHKFILGPALACRRLKVSNPLFSYLEAYLSLLCAATVCVFIIQWPHVLLQ